MSTNLHAAAPQLLKSLKWALLQLEGESGASVSYWQDVPGYRAARLAVLQAEAASVAALAEPVSSASEVRPYTEEEIVAETKRLLSTEKRSFRCDRHLYLELPIGAPVRLKSQWRTLVSAAFPIPFLAAEGCQLIPIAAFEEYPDQDQLSEYYRNWIEGKYEPTRGESGSNPSPGVELAQSARAEAQPRNAGISQCGGPCGDAVAEETTGNAIQTVSGAVNPRV